MRNFDGAQPMSHNDRCAILHQATGAFQGEGARFRRGARRVHVVEKKDRRRNLAASRHAECPLDVFVPEDPGKSRLGNPLPGPGKRQRVERETAVPRKAGCDQRGKVESPPEIFPGVDRYRDHGRGIRGRDQVPPPPRERLAEAKGHRVDREGTAPVFRRDDRGPDVSRVGEQGAGGVERGRGGGAGAAGGRTLRFPERLERPAAGAHGEEVRRPPGDGGGRKVGRCGRQEGPQRSEFGDPCRRSPALRGGAPLPYEIRSLGYPAVGRMGGKAEVIARRSRGRGRRFSGGWRRGRTPGCRGRWRTRSISRRRSTGRST